MRTIPSPLKARSRKTSAANASPRWSVRGGSSSTCAVRVMISLAAGVAGLGRYAKSPSANGSAAVSAPARFSTPGGLLVNRPLTSRASGWSRPSVPVVSSSATARVCARHLVVVAVRGAREVAQRVQRLGMRGAEVVGAGVDDALREGDRAFTVGRRLALAQRHGEVRGHAQHARMLRAEDRLELGAHVLEQGSRAVVRSPASR